MKSSFSDYSHTYIIVNGTIIVANTAAEDVDANNTNKKVIFRNCASFQICTTKIDITQVDNVEVIDVVMSMYNLIEFSKNYKKDQDVYFNFTEIK